MSIKEAVQKVLEMEQGEGTVRISCHLEIEQSEVGINCKKVFEVQKKSGLCFIGHTLKDTVRNAEIEYDEDNIDLFETDFDKIDKFKEFTEMKLVA